LNIKRHSNMEMQWVYFSTIILLAGYIFGNKFVRKCNGWYYHLKLRNKKYPLPPGDMGWPLIGNLLPFIKNFSSGQPDSFTTNLILKSLYFLTLFNFFLSTIYRFVRILLLFMKAYFSQLKNG
jgi:hypothetical protein